jgi:hypothetical protein
MLLLFDSQQSAAEIAEILPGVYDGYNAITLELDEAALSLAIDLVIQSSGKLIEFCREGDCCFVCSRLQCNRDDLEDANGLDRLLIKNLFDSLCDRELIELWQVLREDEDPRGCTSYKQIQSLFIGEDQTDLPVSTLDIFVDCLRQRFPNHLWGKVRLVYAQVANYISLNLNQSFFRFLFEEDLDDWLCFLNRIESNQTLGQHFPAIEMTSIWRWYNDLLLNKVILPSETVKIFGIKLSGKIEGFIYECWSDKRNSRFIWSRWIILDREGNLIGTAYKLEQAVFALLKWKKAFLCYWQNSLKPTLKKLIVSQVILLLPVLGLWLICFIDFLYNTKIATSLVGYSIFAGCCAIAFFVWYTHQSKV